MIVQFWWKPILVIYGATIILWGTLFLEFWKRQQAELAFMWGVLPEQRDDGGGTEKRERPQFSSHPLTISNRPNEITGIKENWTDPEARETRHKWAGVVTTIGILWGIGLNTGAVFFGQWLNGHFGKPFGQSTAAGVLAGAIIVSGMIFEVIAEELTVWQNFKFQEDFDQSLGFKLFWFNFWTKFFSIFFVTFMKARYPGCIDPTETEEKFCRTELQNQLLILFMVELTFGQFMEVFVPWLNMKITNYYNEKAEAEAAARSGTGEGSAAGGGKGSGNGLPHGSGTWGSTGVGSGVGIHVKARMSVTDTELTDNGVNEDLDEVKNPIGPGVFAGAEQIDVKIDGQFQPNPRKAKTTIPSRQLEWLSDDDGAKAAREERLRILNEQRSGRNYEWIQEDHENEAEKGNYWLDGGTLLDYQEMVIQFGYVTLFSLGFPLCPLIAYLNNLIEMRSDAFKLNATQQRPQYRILEGIGYWEDILYLMVMSSIFINMAMLVMFDAASDDFDIFDTHDFGTTVVSMVVAEHIVIVVKLFAEQIIPDRTPWLNTAQEGYDYLQEAVLKDGDRHVMEQADMELKRTQVLTAFESCAEEIERIFQHEARGNPELGKIRAKREKYLSGGDVPLSDEEE